MTVNYWTRQDQLEELRRLLAEPRLVDVERFRHAGGSFWRLTVVCGCEECAPGPVGHEPQVRVLSASEVWKAARLSRRVGRWVTREEAHATARALHRYVSAKGAG